VSKELAAKTKRFSAIADAKNMARQNPVASEAFPGLVNIEQIGLIRLEYI